MKVYRLRSASYDTGKVSTEVMYYIERKKRFLFITWWKCIKKYYSFEYYDAIDDYNQLINKTPAEKHPRENNSKILYTNDTQKMKELIEAAIACNPIYREKYRKGDTGVIGYFVGLIVKSNPYFDSNEVVREVKQQLLKLKPYNENNNN